MSIPDPALITSKTLAARLGVSRSTLHQWTGDDARLAGCIFRRTKHSTWWSVQKLRDRSILPALAPVLINEIQTEVAHADVG
ncbi:MAG: hypothetical protein RL030_2776 [Pseudomonadota bacterium]|jgi:DNA-binding transcriptional regulator YdaS (Cro superfamily)